MALIESKDAAVFAGGRQLAPLSWESWPLSPDLPFREIDWYGDWLANRWRTRGKRKRRTGKRRL